MGIGYSIALKLSSMPKALGLFSEQQRNKRTPNLIFYNTWHICSLAHHGFIDADNTEFPNANNTSGAAKFMFGVVLLVLQSLEQHRQR